MAKKRRNEAVEEREEVEGLLNGETKREKKREKKNKKKQGNEIPTVTIALPGSIIDNTQSFELATRVCTNLFFQISLLVTFN